MAGRFGPFPAGYRSMWATGAHVSQQGTIPDMADYFDRITPEQQALIEAAPLFFVASADPTLDTGSRGVGPVNVSPRGGVPLHVIDARHVAWLDYPGSGNETARHARADGPVTVMVCSFESDDAAIVRLYGSARVYTVEGYPHAERLLDAQAAELVAGPRQIIAVAVSGTQTSCGYGVPVMAPVRDRRREDRGRRYKG